MLEVESAPVHFEALAELIIESERMNTVVFPGAQEENNLSVFEFFASLMRLKQNKIWNFKPLTLYKSEGEIGGMAKRFDFVFRILRDKVQFDPQEMGVSAEQLSCCVKDFSHAY